MSQSVTFNGVTYALPTTGDVDWGAALTAYLVALAPGATPVTLGAVGSTPAAAGASIAGQVLTLQPASATHPGVVTTGAQTFAGTKTFQQEAVIAPSLLSSWSNIGSGFVTAGYWKDPFGNVHIHGLINGGTATPGTVLFNLPAGYRPALSQPFPIVSNGVAGWVYVYSTGDVAVIVGNSASLSLCGITFRAA